MAAHLAEQAQQRHEQYLRAEVASLRAKLTDTEQRLREVGLRLDHMESALASQGLIRSA